MLAVIAAALLASCAVPPAQLAQPAVSDATSAALNGDDLIVVAVAEFPQAVPGAGATPRAGYRQGANYSGGDQALEQAAAVASQHALVEVKAWTIQALRWRCMLYRLPPASDRNGMLTRLAADPRVLLAQPLNRFDTLGAAAAGGAYNDPYLALQTGFASIDAAGAQRVSRGERITVAVIDTAIDARHPDLQGRVATERDFVGRDVPGEHHGTEVAGVIAATANNGLGIVGVAPAARLLPLRACWAEPGSAGARCNSFTLAQALAAAIAGGVDVINLSLGGPRDALLEKLTLHALGRGIVVVGAMPADGRRGGFPTALPGVLAVASSEDGLPAASALAAPGRRVLTLAAGGGYDFASGSSLASAHVSGAVALLRAIDGSLDPEALRQLLAGSSTPAAPAIDACRAVQRLRPATVCTVNAP